MVILESILTTILFEKIRPYFKRKPKNNKPVIHKMAEDMPVFQNVGELRELLKHFSDDVRICGSSFEYPLLQVRVVNGEGLINLGSTNCPPEKPYDYKS